MVNPHVSIILSRSGNKSKCFFCGARRRGSTYFDLRCSAWGQGSSLYCSSQCFQSAAGKSHRMAALAWKDTGLSTPRAAPQGLFFNTENRVEITEPTCARKYAILSAHNYAPYCPGMRIYSDFTAYACIKSPVGAKTGSFAVKIPRHLGKIPRQPNVLGLGGIFKRCLEATNFC